METRARFRPNPEAETLYRREHKTQEKAPDLADDQVDPHRERERALPDGEPLLHLVPGVQ